MDKVRKYIDQLKTIVPQVSQVEAEKLWHKADSLFIDIRETHELQNGTISGSTRLSRSKLELELEGLMHAVAIVIVFCDSGQRSLLATKSLIDAGFSNIYSLEGGFQSWKAANKPTESPALLSSRELHRYSRQISVSEIGERGQLALKKSRVLIVGAGGLGSAAGLYLASAGVGHLAFIDDDHVELHNLQRQVLHSEGRIGIAKVKSAQQHISGINSDVKVVTYQQRLTESNASEFVKDFDLVIDASDNFETRYALNIACKRGKRPCIHGAIHKFQGQVTVFSPDLKSPCYQCLFPSHNQTHLFGDCNGLGVIGMLPGIIGMFQGMEALKIICKVGRPLIGRLLLYDALEASFSELKLKRDPICQVCNEHSTQRQDTNTSHKPACYMMWQSKESLEDELCRN